MTLIKQHKSNHLPKPRTTVTHRRDAVLTERRARFRALDRILKARFPRARIALNYTTTWELLVAVILSAQCTDKKVNEVTPALFSRYPTVAAYAEVSPQALAKYIRPTGYYHAKARHIVGAAQRVLSAYGGEVPRTMEAMLTLPGVGRKTANVVLGNAYWVVEGIAVDTHVKRFAIRFDLTDHTDPVQIERDLMAIVPRTDWVSCTYRIIEYGRQIAPARKYDTSKDPLVALYAEAGKRFRV